MRLIAMKEMDDKEFEEAKQKVIQENRDHLTLASHQIQNNDDLWALNYKISLLLQKEVTLQTFTIEDSFIPKFLIVNNRTFTKCTTLMREGEKVVLYEMMNGDNDLLIELFLPSSLMFMEEIHAMRDYAN